MVSFPEAKMVNVGDVALAVYQAGPAPRSTNKPTVVLMHGWPEIAYSWRFQMAALADAGYPILAPDNRGYGKSNKPEGVENYTINKLTDDYAGLLDAYGVDKAVFVGHDWGAIIMWTLPFYQKDRLLGLAGLNVPLVPRPPVDPITLFRSTFSENMYILRFQEEGFGEAILEKDLARTFRFFFRKPTSVEAAKETAKRLPQKEKLSLLNFLQMDEKLWGGQPLMTDEQIQVYVDAYSDGMKYPLHYYRNFAHNYFDMEQFVDENGQYPFVDLPCLQFLCDLDLACPPSLAKGMDERCGPLETVLLEGCGHWSQIERTEDINTNLLTWLGKNFG